MLARRHARAEDASRYFDAYSHAIRGTPPATALGKLSRAPRFEEASAPRFAELLPRSRARAHAPTRRRHRPDAEDRSDWLTGLFET